MMIRTRLQHLAESDIYYNRDTGTIDRRARIQPQPTILGLLLDLVDTYGVRIEIDAILDVFLE
ncbi:hypothetical protein [Marichromatium gracile]|uniref:Uncharacterized protein n=1 Tax=Marichromatium gracile TaxID=1048 RepID=A0ABR5VDR8_MARGR|nr:hypothetical protein [Marichromatium gracile]KXX63846.1 hypothetical protein AY586_04020 [Marichromatium gracile]